MIRRQPRGGPRKSSKAKLDAARRYQQKMRKDPKYRAKQSRYSRAWRERNKKYLQAVSREYQQANALRILLRRKGLTLKECEAFIKAHKGRCDICGRKPDGRWGKLNIDHCHKKRVLRGLLCSACNRGLGFFKDDPKILRKAIEYLKRRVTQL